jgi:hypothetical protein
MVGRAFDVAQTLLALFPCREVGGSLLGELLPGVCGLVAHRHFQAMAVGILEIDRMTEAVILRAAGIDAGRQQALVRSHQKVHVRHFERDVLHPERRVRIRLLVLISGDLEEGEERAVAELEEDVDAVGGIAVVPVLMTLGRHQAGGIFKPDHLRIEIDGACGILAAIGDMVQALKHRVSSLDRLPMAPLNEAATIEPLSVVDAV